MKKKSGKPFHKGAANPVALGGLLGGSFVFVVSCPVGAFLFRASVRRLEKSDGNYVKEGLSKLWVSCAKKAFWWRWGVAWLVAA